MKKHRLFCFTPQGSFGKWWSPLRFTVHGSCCRDLQPMRQASFLSLAMLGHVFFGLMRAWQRRIAVHRLKVWRLYRPVKYQMSTLSTQLMFLSEGMQILNCLNDCLTVLSVTLSLIFDNRVCFEPPVIMSSYWQHVAQASFVETIFKELVNDGNIWTSA